MSELNEQNSTIEMEKKYPDSDHISWNECWILFAIETFIAQISRALKWGWKPHMKITIQLPLSLDSSKHTFYALTPKKIEFLYEMYQKYAVV